MTIDRNDERGRFEMSVDGHVAYLEFEEDADNLDLVHTEVPDALQGKGVGSKLVHEVLEYARKEFKSVTPTCKFVQSYLERHPEERDVVDV